MIRILIILQIIINLAHSFVIQQQQQQYHHQHHHQPPPITNSLLSRQHDYYYTPPRKQNQQRQQHFDSHVSLSLFRRRRGGRGALEPPPPPSPQPMAPPPPPPPQQQQQHQQQHTINHDASPASTTNAFSQQMGKKSVGRAGRKVTLRRYLHGLVKKHPEVGFPNLNMYTYICIHTYIYIFHILTQDFLFFSIFDTRKTFKNNYLILYSS